MYCGRKAKQSKAKQNKREEQGSDITIRTDDERRTNLIRSRLVRAQKAITRTDNE